MQCPTVYRNNKTCIKIVTNVQNFSSYTISYIKFQSCILSVCFNLVGHFSMQAWLVAARRPFCSHDFTNGRGCQRWSGGPTTLMNKSCEMCLTVTVLLRGEQIMFILLKPRSQSAVLIGMVFTAFRTVLTAGGILTPLLFLNSLYANFTLLSYLSNRVVQSVDNSFSPYSGCTSSGHSGGKLVRIGKKIW